MHLQLLISQSEVVEPPTPKENVDVKPIPGKDGDMLEISAPSNFEHRYHIGWTANGFEVLIYFWIIPKCLLDSFHSG